MMLLTNLNQSKRRNLVHAFPIARRRNSGKELSHDLPFPHKSSPGLQFSVFTGKKGEKTMNLFRLIVSYNTVQRVKEQKNI